MTFPTPAPVGELPPVRLGPAAADRCRRRVHLDADPTARLPEATAAGEQRREDARAHRATVLALLAPSAATGRPSTPPDDDVPVWPPRGAERPPVIVGAVLRSATRVGRPDLLVWDGQGYLPVLIRAHRTLDRGAGALCSPVAEPLAVRPDRSRKARRHRSDGLALAHHVRLLQELGWASPHERGGVVGHGTGPGLPPDDTTILWHDLDPPPMPRAGGTAPTPLTPMADYDRRFADRRDVAVAAVQGRTLALPSRVSECRRCPWWTRCEPELTAARDVSLVVDSADVPRLQAAGVRTVDQLADLDLVTAQLLALGSGTAERPRIRARAWQRGLRLVRLTDTPEMPRADVELDVDSESYLEDGAYLWGTFLSGVAIDATPGFTGFATWAPLTGAQAGEVFARFWAHLTGVRDRAAAAGLTFAAYCWSAAAEERWMRSAPVLYPHVPGMPTPAEVEAFCRSDQWVDVYAQVRRHFLAAGSMRLKAMAPVAGFAYRDADPSGENSLSWYRSAVGLAGPADPALARRILDYNEDDVRATLAVRTWVTEQAHRVPTAAELSAVGEPVAMTSAPPDGPPLNRPPAPDRPSPPPTQEAP